MCAALCFHFFGYTNIFCHIYCYYYNYHYYRYECARAASIALLAAEDVGLGTQGLSYTVLVGGPMSALCLYLYARSFKRNGALFTQRVSNFVCISILLFVTCMMSYLNTLSGKITVVCFYAFREIYVSLLSTQQWSFIASSLDKSTASYLVTFSGIVSVSSAVSGCLLESLVNLGGVKCLLITSLVCSCISYCNVEIAFLLEGDPKIFKFLERLLGAEKAQKLHTSISGHFKDIDTTPLPPKLTTDQPVDLSPTSSARCSADNLATGAGEGSNSKPSIPRNDSKASIPRNDSKAKLGLAENESSSTLDKLEAPKRDVNNTKGVWSDSFVLMSKYHTLQLLLAEAIIHQFCGNMLNLMWHDGLRLNLGDDSYRAVVVGRFFAVVNVTSSLLQCFYMPTVLSQSTLPRAIGSIPFIVLLVSLVVYFSPSLLTTMFAFGTLKVLEYSVFAASAEMIYMPMHSEARYLGKELIRFFGQRLGKTAASLSLSYLISAYSPTLPMQALWSCALTTVWVVVMYILALHLAERQKIIEEDDVDVATAVVTPSVAISQKEVMAETPNASTKTADINTTKAVESDSPGYQLVFPESIGANSDTTDSEENVISSNSESEVGFDRNDGKAASGRQVTKVRSGSLFPSNGEGDNFALTDHEYRRQRRAYTEGGADFLPSKSRTEPVYSPVKSINSSTKPRPDTYCIDPERLFRGKVSMPSFMVRVGSQLSNLDHLASSFSPSSNNTMNNNNKNTNNMQLDVDKKDK